jgi:hypothetical protein
LVLEAEPTDVGTTEPPIAEGTVLTGEPAVAPTPEPAAPEPAASPLDALTGDYRYSGGSSQRASVAKAIDGVANQMSVLARNIARNRLTKANKVPAHVVIATSGAAVTVTIDGNSFTATLGGPSVKVRDQGQSSRLRYELRGDSLYMLLDAADGDRTNVFTPRDDGKGVTMRVTMKSPKLPDTLTYRLTYRG